MGIACIEIYSSAEDMKSSLYILTICFILVHLTSAKPIKDPKELEIEINFVDDEVVVEGQNKARDARNVANKPSDISGSIGGLDLDVVKSNYVEPISSLRQLIPFAKAISVDLDEGKPYPTNNEVANYPPQPINDGCADRKKELDELEKKIQKKDDREGEDENNTEGVADEGEKDAQEERNDGEGAKEEEKDADAKEEKTNEEGAEKEIDTEAVKEENNNEEGADKGKQDAQQEKNDGEGAKEEEKDSDAKEEKNDEEG